MTLLATRPTSEVGPSAGKHRLHEPGGRGGLVEVFRSRTVVQMLVRRDLRVKYRRSSIGYLWEFVQPAFHFIVYYFFIGIVLGLERRVENFAVYVFSGLCLIHFFNMTLNSSTGSIIKNRAIIKKVWLPREIFPIAAMLVAAWRFIPQFIILMIGATATGWYFTWSGGLAAVAGLAIVAIWGTGIGLLVAALNVYIREVSNILQVTSFLTHWLVPMLKPWTLIVSKVAAIGVAGDVIIWLYIYNPLCTAVELFHLAFWEPTVNFYFELSPNLWNRAWIMIVLGLAVLMFAQRLFRRLQANFADEL